MKGDRNPEPIHVTHSLAQTLHADNSDSQNLPFTQVQSTNVFVLRASHRGPEVSLPRVLSGLNRSRDEKSVRDSDAL